MLRNVYLEGELGAKFTPHLSINCEKPAEVFTCLSANFPDFRKYLIEKYEEGMGFDINIAGQEVTDCRELLMEIKEGDITVIPVASGSKSGVAKLLIATAIVLATAGAGAAIATSQGVAAGGLQGGLSAAVSGTLGAGVQIASLAALGIATNLAMAGITQMMAPDPSVDTDQEQSYLFNGAEQNIIEGDPVPILYGKLRVPGQPISFEIAGAKASQGANTGFTLPDGSTTSAGINYSFDYRNIGS